jgi:hypothetical protein
MRIALWLGTFGLVVPLWTVGAIAQDKPSSPNLIENPANSGNTNSTNRVDDRTGNANTMKQQGTSATKDTVGSSVIPPATPNAPRNPSGSGTSTSGGVDYNGDKGADRMSR